MDHPLMLRPTERALLAALAAVGFGALNGAFVYGLFEPGALAAALGNPVALAFVAEAVLLVPLLAWLLRRVGVTRLPWGWFVALALLGGLAFAVPVALLMRPHAAPGAGPPSAGRPAPAP